MIEAFAPAKINLTLHVTGQRHDGYHLLDSLVVFADMGDRLHIEPADHLSLEVAGPFADGVPTDNRNLVWRAAELSSATGRIFLEKNLPHGGGIGGGSSDAAAVLRSLGGTDHALTLGADVPVCMRNTPQRMRGIGENVTHVASVPPLNLVLVNPVAHVPTPDVFRRLIQKQNPPMSVNLSWPEGAGFLDWLGQQRNDLERPAISIAPTIETALDALAGAQLARMSGSGSTCFGVYVDQLRAQQAAETIATLHPDWWVQAVQTVGSLS